MVVKKKKIPENPAYSNIWHYSHV